MASMPSRHPEIQDEPFHIPAGRVVEIGSQVTL
jgi:hypothetical protein